MNLTHDYFVAILRRCFNRYPVLLRPVVYPVKFQRRNGEFYYGLKSDIASCRLCEPFRNFGLRCCRRLRCAPGRARFGVSKSRGSYSAVAAAQARAAANARRVKLMKKAVSMQRKLSAADQTAKKGDLQVASIIYVRLAANRSNRLVAAAAAARSRINYLKNLGRKKLEKIDVEFEEVFSNIHASPTAGESPRDIVSASEADLGTQNKLVLEKFDEFDKLRRDFQFVPQISREIKSHILRQRAKPKFAAILNEPDAKALWQLGRQHERKKQICCAFLVYEKAEHLLPEASAVLAKNRLAKLKQNERVVASAERCRKLEWCHLNYVRAKQLIKVKPVRAREMFFQVVRRSPPDSRIHQEALQQIETIDRVSS